MTNHAAPTLFGTARDKAELYRERYTILHQVSWGWGTPLYWGEKDLREISRIFKGCNVVD